MALNCNDILPWRRDTTYAAESADVLSSTLDTNLAGRVLQTWDDTYNKPLKLRIVQYVGTTITTATQVGVSFSTDSGMLGTKVDAVANAAGEPSKPIDWKLAGKQIAKYDYFYVIEEGPAQVLSSSTVGPATINSPVTVAAGGQLAHALSTTASNHILGYLDNGVVLTTANTNTAVLIHVVGGFGHEY